MSSSGKSKTAVPRLKKASVVVIRTEWNAEIVDELFTGVKKILEQEKINFLDIRVPGAFEIPFTIKKYWETSKKKRPDVFIALCRH
jgi:6,7-dimethyl-8-ribityllumazine synthase